MLQAMIFGVLAAVALSMALLVGLRARRRRKRAPGHVKIDLLKRD